MIDPSAARRRRPLLAVIVVLAARAPAAAQVAVQQPAFGVTTAGGTVLVPDGGSASLGGVASSASAAAAFGLPFPGLGNRAFGRAGGAAGMSVHATIIDFHAMEAALAAEAAGLPGVPSPDREPSPSRPRSFSEELAAIRDAAATPAEAREAVARAKLARGVAKLGAGDLRLARSWILAARNEGGAGIRAEAADLLAEIEGRLTAREAARAPRSPRGPRAGRSPASRGIPAGSPRPTP